VTGHGTSVGAMSPVPDDELLPWWWQRQVDPASPDVVPGPGASQSTTHRNWVLLGTVGGAERAVIDPRGAITPWPDGWSLDWWIGADDTWHLPSRAAGVRQRLLDDTAVVETVARIPGGEMIHRAWAVAAGEGVPEGGAVVVELENASPVPVALAVAVRPFNPLGRAPVSAITLDGTTVSIDGRPAVILPKQPSRVAVGSAAVDAVVPTLAGDAVGTWPDAGARCGSGRASAAFLFPLPHTATLRVLLPLVAARPGTARRRVDGAPLGDPRSAPASDRVVSGWAVQTRRAPRLELPEPRLDEAISAARCFALLHAAGEDVASWPPTIVGGLDTAELSVALDQHGFHSEAERLILGFVDRQGLDGSFAGESTRVDATAAWLHAVGHHVRVTGDPTLADALVGPVAKAAHHLRRRLGARRGRRVEATAGLFPAGPSASWVPTGDGPSYHDALWARRGLLDAAFVLEVAGQPDAAAEPRALAAELTAALVAALGSDAAPGAGPGRASAAGALATAVALAATLTGPEVAPAELAAALVAATDASPALVKGGAWHAPGDAGLSPRLTAWAGSARLAVGRIDAADPLAWLIERGAPVWAWPELVHPRSGGGCAGEGHHAASTAAVLQLARRLAVHEPGGGLALLPAVPDAWLGQPIEAHDVATSYGRLSYAVRWHGERPALLWELEPHDDAAVARALAAVGPLTLTAPGLDPSWSTTELRGEALLASPGRVPAPGRGVDPDSGPDEGPDSGPDEDDATDRSAAPDGPASEVTVEVRPGGVSGRVLDAEPPPGGGSFT
jgi:hypothetical protein